MKCKLLLRHDDDIILLIGQDHKMTALWKM